MATRFSRTLRSVQADGFGLTTPLLAIALPLAGVWGAWMFIARVPVQVVSAHARVELERAVWAIETSVPGKLAESRLELGQAVEKGDILARLDLTEQERDLSARRAQLESNKAQLAALETELEAEEQALADAERSGASAARETAARQVEAELVATLARREYEMTAELRPEGYVSDLSVLRAETEMRRAEGAVASFPATVEREKNERATAHSERLAALARLQRERQRLIGEREITSAQITELERSLERSLEQQILRAPAAGVVAEVAPLAHSTYLAAGSRLGAIVTPADLHVVGEFPPAAALGRVAVGQLATMRLDGFPWSQYGELELEVARVAGEAQRGLLRVEFRLRGEPPPGIDLQHGLAGTCYVEVEEASPAELLLRSAGGGRRESSASAGSGAATAGAGE